ncbi:hypothetical protein LIER_37283 [Lithospermum erythrorhizon]|uniref:Uncharacterized protein n=1 Tax=Lithospermum erythrorhizon TaxID=34254 RepID=A0AAV3PI95_LITER
MEPSRTPIVITLSLFLALLFVVNVTAIRNEPEPFPQHKFELKGVTKAFKLANPNDPEIISAAKFACDEYNKKARASGGTPWIYEHVLKAKTLDLGNGGKKIAIVIGTLDGPLADYSRTLVKVKRNVQKVIAYKAPPEEHY